MKFTLGESRSMPRFLHVGSKMISWSVMHSMFYFTGMAQYCKEARFSAGAGQKNQSGGEMKIRRKTTLVSIVHSLRMPSRGSVPIHPGTQEIVD